MSQGTPSLLWRHRAPSLSDPKFVRTERYAIYDRMREVHPIFLDRATRCWVVTGHAATMAILKDPRFKANRLHTLKGGLQPQEQDHFEELIAGVSRFLLFLDEPDQPRIRALIHKAFTPRRIEALKPHMHEVVAGLLDHVEPDGGMELMSQFAYRLPTTVIAEMLGVPTADHERFREWTEGLAVFLGDLLPSLQKLQTGKESMDAMVAYFAKALKRVRRKPGDDLLSALAVAEEEGNVLSQEEVLSTAILLLAAGHETTANLVGNGVLLLLQNPQAWKDLLANPSLLNGAIEEMLRFESPIQLTGRIASEDCEVMGQPISRGDFLSVALGAANRDPAVFANPHTFDIHRSENRHLSFSHGPHYCLGAMLARAEAHAAFTALLTRFPNLHAEETRGAWKRNQVFRGLAELQVRF